jgi:NAD(P)-dependent dehydrogenase (short-subunit alcohol dehydrogenase family)
MTPVDDEAAVVVTGAAGALGKAVVAEFLAGGVHPVYGDA